MQQWQVKQSCRWWSNPWQERQYWCQLHAQVKNGGTRVALLRVTVSISNAEIAGATHFIQSVSQRRTLTLLYMYIHNASWDLKAQNSNLANVVDHLLPASQVKKDREGMTLFPRGRMTELQRMIWICLLPACSAMNQAMQPWVYWHHNTTTESTRDTSNAQQKRDCKDTDKLVNFLRHKKPVQDDRSLCSIVSGSEASTPVKLKMLERRPQNQCREKLWQKYLKRKQQAATLG